MRRQGGDRHEPRQYRSHAGDKPCKIDIHFTLGIIKNVMTTQILPGLEAFRLSREGQKELETKFQLVLDDANFITRRKEEIRHALPGTCNSSGVYFWVMNVGEFRYRLYIGKTNSLVRRVADYLKEFQAHSPNDYKIRIFQEAILEFEPMAKFNLYFMQVPLDAYTTLETKLIRQYDPLLNRRAKVGKAARESFRNAFAAFYRAGFETLLAK